MSVWRPKPAEVGKAVLVFIVDDKDIKTSAVLFISEQAGRTEEWADRIRRSHTHTHTHARTHARTHTHTHTRTHARTHARTHTHARTYARTHARRL